jgi:alanyl aminopeptidase
MRIVAFLLCAVLALGQRLPPLPDSARPLRYRLELAIDPALPRFQGVAEIDLRLEAPTREVVLHSLGLRMLSVTVLAGGAAAAARAAALHGERLRVILPRQLQPGEATLRFVYSGRFADASAVGAYRRKGPGGWYVYTTFTPIEARRVFPCFDEPRFKTPYEITLRVPARITAAANAPAVEETPESGGWKRIRFAPTAPLPSEVVAFAAGPFDVVEAGAAGARGVPVRILAPKGRGGDAAHAARETDPILRRLEEYTGIPYPWAKLDHVALLEASFGAVENPGLITYRQEALLGAPGGVNAAWLERLRSLMTHELAHQWFGNLVTQARWEDLWLSEGLATWLEMKLTDAAAPEAVRGLRAAESRQRMMEYDATPGARPVRAPIDSRKRARDAYHFTVYQKAAAVVRMIESWLGEETFRRALGIYLERHAHGNASTAGFAAAVRQASGREIAPVLESLLDRPGNPRAALELVCGGHAAPAIKLRQPGTPRQFPVCVRTAAGVSCALLPGSEGEIPLMDQQCPAWVAPNAGGVGYYLADVQDSLTAELSNTR